MGAWRDTEFLGNVVDIVRNRLKGFKRASIENLGGFGMGTSGIGGGTTIRERSTGRRPSGSGRGLVGCGSIVAEDECVGIERLAPSTHTQLGIRREVAFLQVDVEI